MLAIDGGVLEGGGQVVRMAMALSALTSKPIDMKNIRSGRERPGLRAQHLIGLHLIRDITCGQLSGDVLGSTEVTFRPNHITCGNFFGDTKTAGLTLLFQTTLPCLLYSSGTSYLRLKGGTNAEMAPQIDFTTNVLKPILSKFGIHFECDIIRRGFYPKGGGEVVFKVDPIKEIKAIELEEFGQLDKIFGHSFVAGVLPQKLSDIMADSAIDSLREAFPNVSVDIKRVRESREKAFGNGSGIVLWAQSKNGSIIGGSALGKPSLPAEVVGRNAAKELIEDINFGGSVDRYIQDQLIIFMALSRGMSSIRTGPITTHTQTAIHFAQLITGSQFNVKTITESKQHVIECKGISFANQFI